MHISYMYIDIHMYIQSTRGFWGGMIRASLQVQGSPDRVFSCFFSHPFFLVIIIILLPPSSSSSSIGSEAFSLSSWASNLPLQFGDLWSCFSSRPTTCPRCAPPPPLRFFFGTYGLQGLAGFSITPAFVGFRQYPCFFLTQTSKRFLVDLEQLFNLP